MPADPELVRCGEMERMTIDMQLEPLPGKEGIEQWESMTEERSLSD